MRYSFSQQMIIKALDIQLHTMSSDVSVPVLSKQHMSTCREKEIINIITLIPAPFHVQNVASDLHHTQSYQNPKNLIVQSQARGK